MRAGIEDNAENYTRFFLIRKRERVEGDPHPDKVSLAFAVENRPGSLVEALQVFAGMGTNVTRLESRPVPGRPWEYVFYADYQLEEPGTADLALEMLGKALLDGAGAGALSGGGRCLKDTSGAAGSNEGISPERTDCR